MVLRGRHGVVKGFRMWRLGFIGSGLGYSYPLIVTTRGNGDYIRVLIYS